MDDEFEILEVYGPPNPNDDPFNLNTPGRLLVELYPTAQAGVTYLYDDVIVHDYDGCAAWMQEGGTTQDWIHYNIDLELEGFYVIEGLEVTLHRGDGWNIDDDEEWSFALVRRASKSEIETLCLDEKEIRVSEDAKPFKLTKTEEEHIKDAQEAVSLLNKLCSARFYHDLEARKLTNMALRQIKRSLAHAYPGNQF